MRFITVLAIVAMLGACTGPADSDSENQLRIVRDGYGVPHIYADSIYGLYYGYGYAIAQDRLFQMEMSRRSTQGTVAEVLGPDYLDYDRNARTLFSPASIRRQLDSLAPEDSDVFDGYADGINAWLAEIRQAPGELMPRQFIDLEFEPVDWTDYDVAMIFIGTMNNRYGDYNTELENAAILETLVELHGNGPGRELFDLLIPRFTDDAPTTIPAEDWSKPAYDSLAGGTAANLPLRGLEVATSGPVTSGYSNCYVIGRDKVEGGGSILVNGPQFGWFNPSYVYSIGMHGAGIDVVGNTPFGYPMIMFGHNSTITWGSTWGASDIVDIYVENLNPDNSMQYSYKGEYIDFEHRVERIHIKDRDSLEFTVLRSVHGPVIRHDREAGIAYAKKRAWDGGELDTLLAWLRATWARDWEDWKAEAEKSAINVNMYFGDVEGNVGYFHGGVFPRRAPGHDNRLPVTGNGSMEWLGRQSVDLANPHVLNPSSGFVANWNNKPGHGVMNPDFFFYSWSTADRVEYLHDALMANDSFTPDDAWALVEESSYGDVFARYFLPAIDEAIRGSNNTELQAANDILQSWSGSSLDDDGDGVYDEAATGIFRNFIAALIKRTLQDDLGSAYPYFASSGYPTAEAPTAAGTNIPPGVKAIVESLNGNASFDIFNGASPESVILAAMQDALAMNGNRQRPVAGRPFSIRNFLGIPQAGENEGIALPIEQNRGTENNMIVMRPGAIVGWEIAPPGQSGFIAPDGTKSPHYDDQFDMYHSFGRKRMWFYADDVEANKQNERSLTYSRR